MTNNIVLVLNAGSSSLKFSVFDIQYQQELLSGLADRLGSNDPQASLNWKANGNKQSKLLPYADQDSALSELQSLLDEYGLTAQLSAIGHRVVHGGESFYESAIITPDVLEAISCCSHLAPLHNPANILGIRQMQARFPDLQHIAVFDTAFHQSMPKEAYLYALPYAHYRDHGVRRYGFHGTSHRYVGEQAMKQLGLNAQDHCIITAHLGNGCSATAIKNGRSIDTTMGMTPLEGLVMGTRSGDIDPSIHQFLASTLNKNLDEVTAILNKESGLLGISELSNDMRSLCEAAENGNDHAKLAVQLFCYRLAKSICALAMPLGRLDALVFTGGIGENAIRVRDITLQHLSLLHFEMDTSSNEVHGKTNRGIITTPKSTCAAVIPTNEEWAIALDTHRLIHCE